MKTLLSIVLLLGLITSCQPEVIEPTPVTPATPVWTGAYGDLQGTWQQEVVNYTNGLEGSHSAASTIVITGNQYQEGALTYTYTVSNDTLTLYYNETVAPGGVRRILELNPDSFKWIPFGGEAATDIPTPANCNQYELYR